MGDLSDPFVIVSLEACGGGGAEHSSPPLCPLPCPCHKGIAKYVRVPGGPWAVTGWLAGSPCHSAGAP